MIYGGGTYHLNRRDVHKTIFQTGTVTFVEKGRTLTEHAYVYDTGAWKNAKPDHGDVGRIRKTIHQGLRRLKEEYKLPEEVL